MCRIDSRKRLDELQIVEVSTMRMQLRKDQLSKRVCQVVSICVSVVHVCVCVCVCVGMSV